MVAPPGAGKTTRIPPALVDDGPVILLQPRRVAARALARRIASERGWSLGDEVGWHVRFERNFTKRTKLLVATEGILTARFQSDPLLADFRTIVLDEFHERSIHADLALGLAREALEARDDLRLVVMSATLDAERVATFLDCPVIRVESRLYPVDISYAPGSTVADAARNALASSPGQIEFSDKTARHTVDADGFLAQTFSDQDGIAYAIGLVASHEWPLSDHIDVRCECGLCVLDQRCCRGRFTRRPVVVST